MFEFIPNNKPKITKIESKTKPKKTNLGFPKLLGYVYRFLTS